MTDRDRARGTGLRAFAERVFDETTFERVILPALADLQHECARPAGSAAGHRLICWRAYWSVWKTFGVCLATDAVHDPHGVTGTIARRTLACLAGLVPVSVVPTLATEILSPRALTAAEAFKATALLVPQALIATLPAAFFFALVLYRPDERPRGARVIPSLVIGTLACTLLIGILSGIVVPKANDAYRSLVFETVERRARNDALPLPPPPVKGLSEMTWWELNEQIAHPRDSQAEALARARRSEKLAFVSLVPVLALLGYALSHCGRTRGAMFAVALAIQTLYYACLGLAVSNFAPPYLYGPWAVNFAFLLLALWLLRPFSRVSRRDTESRPRSAC